MGDQDFNFNPAPRREAKKTFEPPPWEKAQFEELARRKEAERVAADQAAAEVVLTQAAAQQAVGEETVAAAPATDPTPVVRESGEDKEDPRIEAMLIDLKSEEPPFGPGIWRVSIVAGAILAAIGAVFVVWGIAALAATRRVGATASLGGMILGIFGLMFFSVGAWIVFRTLRQRGVL